VSKGRKQKEEDPGRIKQRIIREKSEGGLDDGNPSTRE